MTGNAHFSVRPDWLAQYDEAVVEPDLPIIDAHHHLWSRPDNMFELEELLGEMRGGHNVVGSVFVECWSHYRAELPAALASLGETEFVARSAARARHPAMQGMIANVDLTLGADAGEILDRHIEAAGGRLRGIRNIAAWHPDPAARGSAATPPSDLMQQDSFREGFAQLAARSLSFDAWNYHSQLADLDDLARTFPDTAIILNHFGGPIHIGPYRNERQKVFDDWAAAMEALAARPNVSVKLGGFGMRLLDFGFQALERPPSSDAIAHVVEPHVDKVIALFGSERCMFESNFPVDKACFSYRVFWNACKKLSAKYSPLQRAQLLARTANDVYRLGIDLGDDGGLLRGPALGQKVFEPGKSGHVV